MAAQLGRWLKYAQAKLDGALRTGEKELDRLELEREAEIAERPWLADDGAAPSIEATRARIEWEADEARRRAEVAEAAEVAAATDAPAAAASPGGDGGDTLEGTLTPAGADPVRPAAMPDAPDLADPEVEAARMELDRQARESKERLEAIRAELGIEPDGPGADPA